MGNTIMSLLVALGADSSGLDKGLAAAEGKSTQSMARISKSMMGIGAAMSIGLTLPLVAFGRSAVQEAMETENAFADLKAVLESTGGAAGVTFEELTKNADALQKTTKFSDDTVMSAQGMLLTFTKIGKDVFPQATMATLDMAEKFKMDASQAAITLGKALNDPIQGVTALRRIGVMLSDEQEAQVKSFMAVNDIASAQKIIMSELSTEIGGVATAAGQTTSGKFTILMHQFDDMKETVGNILIPILLNLANAVLPIITAFGNLSPAAQTTIVAILGIVAAAGPVITVIGSIISVIGTAGPVISGLVTGVTGLVAGLGGFSGIMATIGGILAGPVGWILLLIGAIVLLRAAWVNNWGGMRDFLQAWGAALATTWNQLLFIIGYAWDTLWNAVKASFDVITGAIAAGITAFQTTLTTIWTNLTTGISDTWNNFWAGIQAVFTNAWATLVGIATGIVNGIIGVFTIDWAKLGKDIIQGIGNGLLAMWDWLVQTAKDIAASIADAFAGVLDMGSPSKVMADLGKNIMLGLAQGINDFSSVPLSVTMGVAGSIGAGAGGTALQGQGSNPDQTPLLEEIAALLRAMPIQNKVAFAEAMASMETR